MKRNDFVLVSLGGGGNRLVDTILNKDSRFQGHFINTSLTDMESLENYNPIIKNATCISQVNGVGRNQTIGKAYAEQYIPVIIENILNYPQDTIYLVSSLGGGSGSSILMVLLEYLEQLKLDDDLDKVINVIGIIPSLNSPNVMLENSLNTWNTIFTHNSVVNSMIFIDNSVTNGIMTNNDEEKELEINEKFANMFDSIFDIPDYNGVKFDNGNLGNILRDKGCLYIYELPSGKESISMAFSKSYQNSILAPEVKNFNNIITRDNANLAKCGYLGISTNDEAYDTNFITSRFEITKEVYTGYNESKNLVLISGCQPPTYTMEMIKMELDTRANKPNDKPIETEVIIQFNSKIETKSQPMRKTETKNKDVRKTMKSNLFKRK